MYYRVPFDFTHEEKVFGGYLSLRQMLYVVSSVISLGILFIPNILMIAKACMFLVIFITFMIFAFLKIESGYADRYFLNIVKFIFRKKIYIFER